MNEEITLRVVSSPIKFGGRARINEKTLSDTGMEDGTLVVISSERRDILVSVFSDGLIEEGFISLREEDLRKLGVKEGAKVTMREHSRLLKKKTLDNLL